MMSEPFYLVYDKQCPLCNNYWKMVRIKTSINNLVLIDARVSSHILTVISYPFLRLVRTILLRILSRDKISNLQNNK